MEGGPLPLHVTKIVVPFVGSIDTRTNTFSGRIQITMEWPSTEDDIRAYANNSRAFEPSFTPNLMALNATSSSVKLVSNPSGSAFKIVNRRNHCVFHVDAVFIEDFELENFPFDVQDLKMTFVLASSDAATAHFVVDRRITAFTCLTQYTALPEWDFRKVIAYEDERDDCSHLNAAVMVRRRPWVYLLKLASFSTVPNYIALLAFIFPPYEFGSRIGVLLTLILALTGVVSA